MGGVGLFRRVVLRREFHLFSPITRGIQWLLRLHLDGSVGWAGLGWEAKAWLGKTMFMCSPGMRMNTRDCDLLQG